MSPTLRFRPAVRSEAESITILINSAFRVEEFFIDGDRIQLDQVQAFFEHGEFLVAEDGASLAGCVYVELRGERGYFGLLSIEPSRQRTGLGSRLVTAAEGRCREKGCRFMDLQIVNLREELPAFYQHLGYTETGTGPFPADSPTKLPCYFIRMSKPL